MGEIDPMRVNRLPPLAVLLRRCSAKRRLRPPKRAPRNRAFCCRCQYSYLQRRPSQSRLGVVKVDQPLSSFGSNTMPRGRPEDESTLHWIERQKEELLMRLAAYNRSANGRKPDSKAWEDWAKELQEFFKDQVTPAKVQQMKVRLKAKFDHELMLRNNTRLGWDPVTGSVTCTDEYWEDFAKNKKWAKSAKNQPLKNFDLYYEAFGGRRASGALEKGLDKPTNIEEGTIPVSDQEGATSDEGGSDDGFVSTMRAGLDNAARGLNIAASSKAIGKKPTKSSRRLTGDPEARELIGRLVPSIESKHSSHTKSSSANQTGANNDLQDRCQEIVKEMALDDETAITFLEAIVWYPNMQQLFVKMSESQRTLFVTRTINTSRTQTHGLFSNPHNPMGTQFMPPPFPNFMSQPTNYMQPTPFFGQQPSNNIPRSPNFGGQQLVPPFPNISQNYNPQQPAAYSPQTPYYMPHFPPPLGHFGGDGSSDQL